MKYSDFYEIVKNNDLIDWYLVGLDYSEKYIVIKNFSFSIKIGDLVFIQTNHKYVKKNVYYIYNNKICYMILDLEQINEHFISHRKYTINKLLNEI